MPAKAKGRGKAPKGHKLCEPLPKGEVVKDLMKNYWRIGESVGSGGFGLIYLANESSRSIDKENAAYVIKIEPQSNGPLFSEIAFYQRAAKSDQIQQWKKKHKCLFLGVPPYIAHGLHDHNGEALRFLVMPRFGPDIHHLWLQADKKFKRTTVSKIALMMIDALEYMHDREYVHADIKGANILCDYKDSKRIFLVDYGLAYRYTIDGQHKAYEPDPRKAHNGTIEYTSIDAHKGANPSRRGDIEILGYVLLHLLSGKLPWEDRLSDCNRVRDEKIKQMNNVEALVQKSCGEHVPEITQILEAAKDLEYDETPNYNRLRGYFRDSLKSMGVLLNSALDFKSASNGNSTKFEGPSPKKARKIKLSGQKRPAVASARKDSSTDLSSVDGDHAKKSKYERRRRIPISSQGSEASSSTSGAKISNGKPRNSQLETDSDGSLSDVSEVSEEECSSSPKRQKRVMKTSSNKRKQSMKARSSKSTTSESDFDNKHSAQKSRSCAPIPKSGRTLRQRTPKVMPDPPSKSNSELGYESGSDESRSTVINKRKKASSPAKQNRSNKASTSSNKTSRHSMAPLHTDPVLTKNDELTGEYRGKHPLFVRRRKVNVKKTNATTQTTPTISKVKSRK